MAFVKSAVLRFLFIVGYMLLSFWPDYGAVFQISRYFLDQPLVWSVIAGLWVVLGLLLLPLPLHLFKLLSSAIFAGLMGFGVLEMAQAGWLTGTNAIIFTLIGCAAVMLFWLMVSTPVWRWARFTVVVQAANHD